jgi:hypothetical protein
MQKLFLPVPLFGAEGDDDAGDGDESENDSQEESRSLTSTELEKMTARAASRGSRKALKDLKSELGFDDMDALKGFIIEKREADDAAQSDQDKAVAEFEDLKSSTRDALSEAKGIRLDATIERAIIRAGVIDDKKAARISTLVHADLDTDLDAEDLAEALSTAIEGLKTDMPELFVISGTGSGDGGSKGSSQGDSDEDADREKKILAEYARRGLRPVST